MTPRRRRSFNLEVEHSRTFFQLGRGSVPSKGPTPVHTDFIVTVYNVRAAKLMAKDLSVILRNANCKLFVPVGPIRIANPKLVLTGARNLQILPQQSLTLIGAGGGRIPFALATLRPLGRDSWTIHSPSRSSCFWKIEPGGIRDRFAPTVGCKAPHVLCFNPEILVMCGWGDRVKRRSGDKGEAL